MIKINVLKIGSVTELKKLLFHGLGAEPQSTRIKPGPKRSLVEGPTSLMFGPIFRTPIKIYKI